MDERQLERMAAELGRKRAREVDPEATARAVLARLRTEGTRESWWQRVAARPRRALAPVAAAALILLVAVFGLRQLGGPDMMADGDLPIEVGIEQLAEDELNAVLDSLEYEAPVYELVPVALADLNEDELSALLETLEG